MKTIEEVVEITGAVQVPMICLDTCDFLDVVRIVAEGDLRHAESFRLMLDNLGFDPSPFHLVITELVRQEWEQNKDGERGRKVVEKLLKEAANLARRVAKVRKIGGLPAIAVDEILFDPSLAQSLIGLAEDVMDRAIVLARDDACVARALERVLLKRRPSRHDKIKDSIHWEHYLELSRRLMRAGHASFRVFVSANKSDFWNGDKPSLHPDLPRESSEAGLLFFGRLSSALGKIGLLQADSPSEIGNEIPPLG